MPSTLIAQHRRYFFAWLRRDGELWKVLVKEAENQGVTQDVITAHVNEAGEVKLKGHLDSDAINPIVQVVLKENKEVDPDVNAEWFKMC